jgi:hypothetical protein
MWSRARVVRACAKPAGGQVSTKQRVYVSTAQKIELAVPQAVAARLLDRPTWWRGPSVKSVMPWKLLMAMLHD